MEISTTGFFNCLAIPNEKKPDERSSTWLKHLIPSVWVNANVSAEFLAPGEMHTL